MFIRMLQVFLLTTGIIFSGCQKQNTAISPAANNTQVPIENNNISKPVDADKIATDNSKQKSKIVAYYFHRTFRCPTCLAIEANVARTIEDNFQQQMVEENLMWVPFNLDDPGGEKFEKQFDISVSTLVIAKMQDNEVAKFKKLDKVWQLVGNNQAFSEYVKSEIQEYLNDK